MVYNIPVWTVYCRTNKINGKKYVGVTSKTIEERWQAFREEVELLVFKQSSRKKQIKKLLPGTLAGDFHLHGDVAFEHAILERCENPLLALLFERKWIVAFNCLKLNGHGYNRTAGGEVLLNHSTLVSLEQLIDYVDEIKRDGQRVNGLSPSTGQTCCGSTM